MESNDTLTQMRSQMQALRDKLENQRIISSELLKKSYRSGLSSLKTKSSMTYIFALIAMLCAPSFYVTGFSIWLVCLTELLMLVCIIATVLTNRHLPDMNSDLVTAAEGLSKFKMKYVAWLKYGIILMLFWIGWIIGEIIGRKSFDGNEIYFICGAAIGLVIGILAGFRIRRKIIEPTEELLDQIEGLREI